MKKMGEHTRQGPEERTRELKKFADSLVKPEIKEELDAWNLAFSKDLIKFRARILETGKVQNNSFYSRYVLFLQRPFWVREAARPATSWRMQIGAVPSENGTPSRWGIVRSGR